MKLSKKIMGKGKWRNSMTDCSDCSERVQCQLPPPPPLQPRPGLMSAATSLDFEDQLLETDLELSQPLDYTMKRLQGSSSGRSSNCSNCSSGSDVVLHRLKQTVLQRQPSSQHQQHSQLLHFRQCPPKQLQEALITMASAAASAAAATQAKSSQPQQATTLAQSDTDCRAAYAAECIKSRLDGCGKRVHLFLGILLHFGMPPGQNGETVFDRVIAFSDEHRNLSDKPTAYFMVLDSKLLALIWCKFKGNSSNEYSTLTRAIRSTRQKYKGIFEAVENPGKKLYKFGPLALQQFRQLFPNSYRPFSREVA